MRIGYGIRTSHYSDILSGPAHAPHVELIAENFINRGGRPRAMIEHLRTSNVELLVHSVGLSLGGTEPLSEDHLAGLASLVSECQPKVVSDHICFGSVGGFYGHDLWPLPYTEEAIANIVNRIDEVQARLKRPIAVENVSSYVAFSSSEMPEWQFVREIVERSGCDLLLDVNNVYVSAKNHGFDAMTYLSHMPYRRVTQMHLAGHSARQGYLLDDHSGPVCDEVMSLFLYAQARAPHARVILEWDENVPPFDALIAETQRVEAELTKAAAA